MCVCVCVHMRAHAHMCARKLTLVNVLSHIKLFATPWTCRLLCPWDFPGKNNGVGCHFLLQEIFQPSNQTVSPALQTSSLLLSHWGSHIYAQWDIAAAAKSLQSCPTLCDPIDGSPPGSAIPGILQARTPEWVAISFSNAWKWKVKVKSLSRVWLLATPWIAAYQAPPSMGFSKQEYWSGVPLPSPQWNITQS